jgi:hypothetical protein
MVSAAGVGSFPLSRRSREAECPQRSVSPQQNCRSISSRQRRTMNPCTVWHLPSLSGAPGMLGLLSGSGELVTPVLCSGFSPSFARTRWCSHSRPPDTNQSAADELGVLPKVVRPSAAAGHLLIASYVWPLPRLLR